VKRIGILEGRDFSAAARAELERMGSVIVYDGVGLARFLSDLEVLFIRLAHRIDAEFLAMAARLEVLVSPTTGLTHIDLDTVRSRGVSVLSLRGERDFLRTVTATPEHALGLIIALLRNYAHAFLRPQHAAWDRDAVRGHDLAGRTVGIVGFGRVGQLLGRALTQLGARVSFTDPCVQLEVSGCLRCSDVTSLVAGSDVVVLAASHRNGEPPIVDARLIDAMGGKYFVNIARGELVDEEHLLSRIATGHFAGVALDVLCNEAGDMDRLARFVEQVPHRNLILTPHIGGATFESSARTELYMVQRLREHLEQPP
jgi:D-3-phosphoglycerate dehydrogenase